MTSWAREDDVGEVFHVNNGETREAGVASRPYQANLNAEQGTASGVSGGWRRMSSDIAPREDDWGTSVEESRDGNPFDVRAFHPSDIRYKQFGAERGTRYVVEEEGLSHKPFSSYRGMPRFSSGRSIRGGASAGSARRARATSPPSARPPLRDPRRHVSVSREFGGDDQQEQQRAQDRLGVSQKASVGRDGAGVRRMDSEYFQYRDGGLALGEEKDDAWDDDGEVVERWSSTLNTEGEAHLERSHLWYDREREQYPEGGGLESTRRGSNIGDVDQRDGNTAELDSTALSNGMKIDHEVSVEKVGAGASTAAVTADDDSSSDAYGLAAVFDDEKFATPGQRLLENDPDDSETVDPPAVTRNEQRDISDNGDQATQEEVAITVESPLSRSSDGATVRSLAGQLLDAEVAEDQPVNEKEACRGGVRSGGDSGRWGADAALESEIMDVLASMVVGASPSAPD